MTPMKRGNAATMAAGVGPQIGLRDGPALGVVGVGLDAPSDGEAIGLHAVLHDRHGLGRLAEGDGQHAGGERIERAGVAGLLGVEQKLQPSDRLGRGDADGLVEIDPAVHLGARYAALRRPGGPGRYAVRFAVHFVSSSSCLRSRATRGLRSSCVHARLNVEALVEDEAQIRGVFEIDPPGHERPQRLLVRLQGGQRLAAIRRRRAAGRRPLRA